MLHMFCHALCSGVFVTLNGDLIFALERLYQNLEYLPFIKTLPKRLLGHTDRADLPANEVEKLL